LSTWKDELEYLLTISGHRRTVSLPTANGRPANNKAPARTKTPVQETPVQNEKQLKSLASRIQGMHAALTAVELAKLLGLSKATILRQAKKGAIPSFRIGNVVRFDPQSISKWLIDHGVKSLTK
jgi:excisionase family DNA binding protein